MTEERSIGRTTVITEEEAIFERIEAGESISAITKTEGFPSSRTLYRRVESDEEFKSRFKLVTDGAVRDVGGRNSEY